MNSEVQDIIDLYQQIVSNLDQDPQRDVTIEQLKNERNYCTIFRIMFPFLEKEIDNIQKERNPTGEKLQGLIEFLSYPVLTMDLSHISGHSIAQGDLRHLYNFLQILLELSKLYKDQVQNPGSNLSSQQNSQLNNSNPHERQFDSFNDNPGYEESSEGDGGNKQTQQIKRIKSQKDLKQSGDKDKNATIKNLQQNNQKKTSTKVPNSKENQLKAISNNLLPVTPNYNRELLHKIQICLLNTRSNNNNSRVKGLHKQINHKKIQSIPKMKNISDIDYDFLQQHDEEEINQLEDDDPIKAKYQREQQKDNIRKLLQEKEGEEQGEQPEIDNFIDFQIQVIKESLAKMKSQPPSDEKETIEKIIKNRNQYKEFLKDYLKTYQQKQKKQESLQNKSMRSQKQLTKMNQKKKDDLKKEFENEHLSMYYKLRDEKLNYLRKIHRIIFELEKRKIIDEKKDHLQVRRQQNIITRNALASVENAYNDKISMLKEKLQNERKERHVAGVAQKQVNQFLMIFKILSKLEKELRDEKIKQIQELKDIWRQEKERFDYLMKDDGELEKRILQIYKKY
ncbi:unnamed protein product (macronuclear) [Paramecium tetraurelia]|uniref:DUF5745 domain-containing protein n=1 Tax=Paramecium tetraurelia TaxID=5888 RepID=A0DG75_PARTE|nr:uncharacterized protein GSPATT00002171001 [Paramecium tetraurelia]CAK82042.1 unnamed protein product [Paramecium tetraurelia]|eukprot:XP_001449439.1 hypothetical protein (macronuclear) [Paramecium tetraurelia strain d4-2]